MHALRSADPFPLDFGRYSSLADSSHEVKKVKKKYVKGYKL
jgi:hypothetical protein